MELLKVVCLLTDTCKLYRLACNRENRQSRAASCIAVQRCKDNACNVKHTVERFCNVYSVLTGHRVNNEQYLIRLNLSLYILKLVHQVFIYMQTACGIKDNNVKTVVLCVFYRLFRYLHGICLSHLEYMSINRGTDYLQLIDSGRTVNIAGY